MDAECDSGPAKEDYCDLISADGGLGSPLTVREGNFNANFGGSSLAVAVVAGYHVLAQMKLLFSSTA